MEGIYEVIHRIVIKSFFSSRRCPVSSLYCLLRQDTGIEICAPEVLFLYTDNFDFQHPRADFLRGVLNDDVWGPRGLEGMEASMTRTAWPWNHFLIICLLSWLN